MKQRNLNVDEALELISAARAIQPNQGFRDQLEMWHKKLQNLSTEENDQMQDKEDLVLLDYK